MELMQRMDGTSFRATCGTLCFCTLAGSSVHPSILTRLDSMLSSWHVGNGEWTCVSLCFVSNTKHGTQSFLFQDCACCLAGSFAAYGRGMIKSFEKVQIFVGNREFTLFMEYLARNNIYRKKTLPPYVCVGISDGVSKGGRKRETQPWRLYEQQQNTIRVNIRLMDSVYKVEPRNGRGSDVSCPPVTIELIVVSRLSDSILPIGHSAHECLSHQRSRLRWCYSY